MPIGGWVLSQFVGDKLIRFSRLLGNLTERTPQSARENTT